MISTTTENFDKPIVVQKYGGSCLSSTEDIEFAADKILKLRNKNKHVIVVVSAMAGTTNELISLAHKITPTPHRREMDMLISAGERISMSLMAMALQKRGIPAISFTGSQAGILTNTSHSDAEILDIKPIRVTEALQQNKVVVIAGFQGVNPNTKEVTTLGRGGTDVTAVAFASHFKAEECQFLKDVDGVYNCDPKITKNITSISQIDTLSFYKASLWGAGVLQNRCLKLALEHKLELKLGHFKSEHFSTSISPDYKGDTPYLLSVRDSVFVFNKSQDNEDILTKITQSLVQKDLYPPQVLYNGKKGLILAAYEEYIPEYQQIFEDQNIDFQIGSSVNIVGSSQIESDENLFNPIKSDPNLIFWLNDSNPPSLTLICSHKSAGTFITKIEDLLCLK